MFGFLFGLGIVVGAVLADWRARAVGQDPDVIRWIARSSSVCGLSGAHVVHLVAHHSEELARDPWGILKV